jgi:hypothetical protein
MSFEHILRVVRVTALAVVVLSALPARADTPATVIDWSQGDVQDTKASCGNITLKNLPERHATSLWVRGTTPGVCSFAADGLTFHMPADSGATAQGTTTLFVFQRIGSDVLVTWTPGY